LFEIDDLAIRVLKWDAGTNGEGVAMYATLGASTWSLAGRDRSHRVEFFVGLAPAQDGIARALAALGLYGVRDEVALDHGHTVPGGGPLWPGSAMRSFLVLRPLAGFLEPLAPSDGLHVEFLQAVPIYESEKAFKSEHGVDSLLRRWEDTSLAFWDSNRDPDPGAT
jgi:hypothetical protein